MKLTGTRCTLLSYKSKTLNKIHEKSFQILNRQHRIVIPKNYEVNFDCSSLLSEGSKPQHRKELKLRIQLRASERRAQRELQIFGRGFLHVFSWVLINRCIWNYPMLGEEPPEWNKQNNPWDSNRGSYSSCSHQTKWENFLIIHGALVGYSEGSLFLQ